jgi:hypothetical protein
VDTDITLADLKGTFARSFKAWLDEIAGYVFARRIFLLRSPALR